MKQDLDGASSDDMQNREDDRKEESEPHALFHAMAHFPWPFLILIPAIFVLLIYFGWSIEDKVEKEVEALWIAEGGDYAADKRYAEDKGGSDLSVSTFAAMAITRDGGNIFRADRLEEVRARMEAAEGTKITYKDVEYTWDDFCGSNSAPYQFPCLRLSPMDLFQEARWTFSLPERVGWYRNVVQKLLVDPRLPRFGVLTEVCPQQCGELLQLRAETPLLLFADLGNMEFNDPCRMCVEAGYQKTIEDLTALMKPQFGALAQELVRFAETLGDDATKAARVQELAGKLGTLAATITSADVVDFYKYYVTRGLYVQLGTPSFLGNYPAADELFRGCAGVVGFLVGAMQCPPFADEVAGNVTFAQMSLAAHADAPFSSLNTAGVPFAMYDEVGDMFGVNGTLRPFGGSGVRMSAPIMSLAEDYLDLRNIQTPEQWNPAYTVGGFADPDSEEWKTLVEPNPMYAWFMAGVTPAEPGTACGNNPLPPANSVADQFNNITVGAAMAVSQSWCTPFDVIDPATMPTKQDYARMWYDLLLASGGFLNLKQGEDDPYTWTTGSGCDYNLAGGRYAYTGQSEADILSNASRLVYNIDEGVSIGAVDRNILIGGVDPVVGEYDFENPLNRARVVQTIYASLIAKDIVVRVKNCNRPGGPQDISLQDAEELLFRWKEAMENTWTEGWDDENAGDVQFVSLFDDAGGTIGSTGRMLEQITLDNSQLTAVSIILIAVFSAIFLFSFDLVESRVLVTLVGVGLVVVSFFAALGFGILTIAWTLPFVIIGLGVDDVYIILMSLKAQRGYSEKHWHEAMKEVIVPVSMTSFVNASMFAVLNVSDIPAVFLTARVACFCVIALYVSVILCFPAFCYLDLKRQEAGRIDMCCAKKTNRQGPSNAEEEDFRNVLIYDNFYKKLILNDDNNIRYGMHFWVFTLSLALFVGGMVGITKREVGLGLEDFFPPSNPSSRWATYRTEELSSWSIGMTWGEVDITDPDLQMKMIGQFEGVVGTPKVAEVDTKQMWVADFQMWTSRHCGDNFDRSDFDKLECGRDQEFSDDSFCSGTWTENIYGLREKAFADPASPVCLEYEGGICRPGTQMHPLDLEEMGVDPVIAADKSYCPIIADWSEEKWQFCLKSWRNITGSTSGSLLVEKGSATPTACSGVDYGDGDIKWPIKISSSPTMFGFDLFSHEDTLDMMRDARAICDDDEEVHCFTVGIPFDYWSQYEGIFGVLVVLSSCATGAGFVIAFLFLFGTFLSEGLHKASTVLAASLVGALLIVVTIIVTLIPVVGLSILVGVNLTGFSNMSFVLSVGFAVEYSVHIVSRFMRADSSFVTPVDRVAHTMSFLTLPTFMSFVSSTIGVVCLAFTEFEFNLVFFFRPLIIVMFVSYWMGCWFLPVVLCYLDFDAVRMGPTVQATENEFAQKKLEDSDGTPEKDTKGDVEAEDTTANVRLDL